MNKTNEVGINLYFLSKNNTFYTKKCYFMNKDFDGRNKRRTQLVGEAYNSPFYANYMEKSCRTNGSFVRQMSDRQNVVTIDDFGNVNYGLLLLILFI